MITNNIQLSPSASCYSKPWRPDTDCDREEIWFDAVRGFLYIDFRKSCGTCLRISAWSKGLSLSRWNDVMQAWCPEEGDPGIPIPMENRKTLYGDALEMFFREIPVEIKDIVRSFKWRQFILLKMILQCPEMLELMQSNPMLAWLLADAAAEKEIPLSEARLWVLRKRKEILQFVCGNASESVVKVLSRIRFDENRFDPDISNLEELRNREAGSHSSFIALKELISNDHLMHDLRTVKLIPVTNVPDLNERPDLALWILVNNIRSSGPYYALAHDERESVIRGFWQDTLRMGENLCIKNRVSMMKNCRSLESLNKLHDRWARVLTVERKTATLRNFREAHGTNTFPPPPLQGCAEIVPIVTIDELFAEGQEMHNCVASYAERIMNGKCWIFKVLHPERATLELAAENNVLLLRQLKTVCNGKPAEHTQMFVEKWIAAQGWKPDETR